MVKNPSVALVYDRVNTAFGGAERVLLALHQAFPDAPLYTAVADKRASRWAEVFEIRTSWLQQVPFASRLHRLLASLMPLAFESFDLSNFDVIISVTSAEAKAVITRTNQLHVCYLLSPPRYLYHQRDELVNAAWWSSVPGLSQLGKLALKYLTWWDQTAMSRPDIVIPLSKVVANRFKKIYGRTANPVLYPPIETKHLTPKITQQKLKQFADTHPHFLLLIARLVTYKRVDLAIAAAKKCNVPLIIVGDGPDFIQLSSQTGVTTLLIPKVSESELAWLYSNCTMVLIPGVEDFGLTALEANAYGKPAVINKNAGASEVIDDGIHGVHVQKTTLESLVTAILSCQKLAFSPTVLRQNASKYDTSIFVTEFKSMVKIEWGKQQSRIIHS